MEEPLAGQREPDSGSVSPVTSRITGTEGNTANLTKLPIAKRKTQMAQQIERLAGFVAETTLEQVPKEVQRHAKLVVLDTIGVILAGASRPEVRGCASD
jgi:hypothetical protein